MPATLLKLQALSVTANAPSGSLFAPVAILKIASTAMAKQSPINRRRCPVSMAYPSQQATASVLLMATFLILSLWRATRTGVVSQAIACPAQSPKAAGP